MKLQFANSKLEYELLDGEYLRYSEEQYGEYLCIGVFNTNRVLFQYIDINNDPIDFVQSIISNIPDFALDYLTNVLTNNNNILVRLTFYPGTPTSFEIYYDCDCETNNINILINWMNEHNDFSAVDYRYTEVINGHQKCVGD